MTVFVLDNSVAMRWLLESEKLADQKYAENVLKSFTGADALVPNLWHLEVLGAEKRLEVNSGEVECFISQLENLPVHVDPFTSRVSCPRGTAISHA